MEIKDAVVIPIEMLVANEDNPNQMSEKELNKLCDNILKIGFTEPLIVGSIGDGKFEVVSGHHRLKAARNLGMPELPCIVYKKWDKEKRDMVMVRMNVIRGKLSPQKFIGLYQKYAEKYGEDMVKDMMGFTDEMALHELLNAVSRGLPEGMAKRLRSKEEEGEIETIGQLEKVLTVLFSEYGHTVPYNFMFFVHGGSKHVMQKTDKELWDLVTKIYEAVEEKRLDAISVFKDLLSDWESVCDI